MLLRSVDLSDMDWFGWRLPAPAGLSCLLHQPCCYVILQRASAGDQCPCYLLQPRSRGSTKRGRLRIRGVLMCLCCVSGVMQTLAVCRTPGLGHCQDCQQVGSTPGLLVPCLHITCERSDMQHLTHCSHRCLHMSGPRS